MERAATWRTWLRDLDDVGPELSAALVRANVARLRILSGVAVVVSVGHLVVFGVLETAGETEQRWRAAILLAHAGLAASMVLLWAGSRRATGQPPSVTRDRLLQVVALVVVFVAGITIAVADQLVTSNITPLLVACVVAGTVFAVPPRWSVPMFVLVAAVFALALGVVSGVVSGDGASVLSNRVNGLTFAGIGLGLSLVRWSSDVRDLRQRRRIAQQQQQLELRNSELEYLAARDDLTGLLNRREFSLLFDHELARLRREGAPAALLLLDLDGFKDVNDRHGHPVGDALLVEVAALLRTRLRSSDLISRWGGEEFLVLLPGVELPRAHVIAETQRHFIEERTFRLDGHEVRTTVSIGVAEVSVEHRDALGPAYRQADAALYAAKRSGRNQVVVASG